MLVTCHNEVNAIVTSTAVLVECFSSIHASKVSAVQDMGVILYKNIISFRQSFALYSLKHQSSLWNQKDAQCKSILCFNCRQFIWHHLIYLQTCNQGTRQSSVVVSFDYDNVRSTSSTNKLPILYNSSSTAETHIHD